jgi:signal transduction histidine kinase
MARASRFIAGEAASTQPVMNLLRLNTQTRLIALLCLLIGVFGTAFWMLRLSHEQEAAQMVTDVRTDRCKLLGGLLDLTGESLKNFANDYSYWDEMLKFVGTGDPEWGRANVEASLVTFHANAAWVLGIDGQLVYSAVREIDPAFRAVPLPVAELVSRLQGRKFLHFFSATPAGVMEFRGAPIQPSADSARASIPGGWFLVARLWNDEHLHAIQRVMDGSVALDRLGTTAPAPEERTVRITQPLADWDNRPVARLRLDYQSKTLALLTQENQEEKLLFFVFGGVMIGFVALALGRWVLRPLHRLEMGMATNSAEPLGDLVRESDIFGRLATLVRVSAEQRHALEREVEERRRIERALRQSEEELRYSSQLKARLARDLHDGVIQSIYATGLGLEGMRQKLRLDPAAAEQRLDAAQNSLNQTIREVRSFIQGLEPDESDRPDFSTSLQTLISTLKSLHPVDLRLQLDSTPLRLTAREEVHALQIVRECVSNALRHGQARRIDVQFRATPAGPEMMVRDDGRGFDPVAARGQGGSGLSNLSSRANEVEARLDIRSSPGNGTTVSLLFPPR